MTSEQLDSDDKRKLHAEVNQIVNQRLYITTLSVLVFGTMMAWLIPQQSDISGSSECIGIFRYIASILLGVVLFALFLLTHFLTVMLRIISTYLIVSGSSIWEKDWQAYRKKKFTYFGYTKPQAIVFLVLGIVSSGFPFLLRALYPLTLEPIAGAIICAFFGAFYVIFVWGMGLRGWFIKEDDLRRRWEELKNE